MKRTAQLVLAVLVGAAGAAACGQGSKGVRAGQTGTTVGLPSTTMAPPTSTSTVLAPPTTPTTVLASRPPRTAPAGGAPRSGLSVTNSGQAHCDTGGNVAVGNASSGNAVAGGTGGINLGSASNRTHGESHVSQGACRSVGG